MKLTINQGLKWQLYKYASLLRFYIYEHGAGPKGPAPSKPLLDKAVIECLPLFPLPKHRGKTSQKQQPSYQPQNHVPCNVGVHWSDRKVCHGEDGRRQSQ